MRAQVGTAARIRRLLVACALVHGLGLFLHSVAYAQTGNVAGMVTDAESDRPVVNARVFVPGTPLTTFTNESGRYVLSGVAVGEVLVRLERTGYATAERTLLVPVDQTVIADVELQVSALALDALVVTATGLQRRRELGNAATTIDVDEELRLRTPISVTNLLQGRATGVQIMTSSGSVGTASSVKIRGNGSIALGDSPLVYIDGSRVSNDMESGPDVGGQNTSRLNDLAMDDIESIEIVKGPSAATLYGVEAAAGVIRITTKRGRAGTAEWTVRSEVGASWDGTAWPTTVWNPRSNLGVQLDVSELFAPGQVPPGQFFAQIPDTLYTLDLLSGGDGFQKPWRTGYEQVHGLSLRGGSSNVTYYLSGEWVDQSGTLANNEAMRRSLRANFNLIPSQELDVALSTSYADSRILLPDSDNSAFGYIGVGMLSSPWGKSVTRTDLALGGEFETCPLAYELQRAMVDAGVSPLSLEELTEDQCPDNPFFSERTFDDIATLVNEQDVERFTGNATFNYRPRDFLLARATFGYDQFVDQTGFLIPIDPDLPFGDSSRGVRSITNQLNRIMSAEGNVTATFTPLPDLRAITNVGGQFVRQKFEGTGATGRYLPVGSTTVSGAVRTTGFEFNEETRTLGLFVEEQLGWRDRLFVTPAVRFDDSSAFGRNLGRAAHPRIGVSYLVSEEDWFSGFVPESLIQSLRLRGSWGESGTQPAAFAALKRLGPRRVTFNGNDVSGLSLAAAGNPELKAERGEEIEVGFEAGLLNERVGLEFTYFYEITKDAIVGTFLAPSTGYESALFTNVARMRNRGVEIRTTALLLNRESLRWDAELNLSTVQGRITRLDEPVVFGLGDDSQRLQQGYPLGAYFSRYYQASNGQVAESDSAVFLGTPTPQYEGSLATSVSLTNGISIHANIGFAGGHKQLNYTERFRCTFYGGGQYGGVCPEIYERDANGELTNEALEKAAAAEDLEIAPWVEPADFARLRTLSIRYELPTGWLSRVRALRGNFTLSGENLFLITRYSGLDPEVNFAGGSVSARAEFFTLPPARRFTGRLSLTF